MHFRKYICYKDDIDSDIKNNELLIMELFGLGDLYSLPRLKAQIEAEMKETLSVKNVAGRLMMSVRHNSPLTEACTDFVRANLKEVIKAKDWADVTKDAFMASLIALEKVTMTMVPAQIQAPSERGTSDQFYFG